MLRTLLIVNLFVLFGIFANAQKEPVHLQDNRELEGTWYLDDKYVKTYGKQVFVITSADNQLRIMKNQDFRGTLKHWELILFTDKRGEKNTIPTGKNETNEVESKTTWVKNELVRIFRRTQTTGQLMRFDVTERYSILQDNDKLILRVEECNLDSPLPDNLACHDFDRTYRRQGK